LMEKLSGEMEETSCYGKESGMNWYQLETQAREGGGGRRREGEGRKEGRTHSDETFPLIREIELSYSSNSFSDLYIVSRERESQLGRGRR